MAKEIYPYAIALAILVQLQNENIELKRQIESDKIQKVSRDVAEHIDKWLNNPYKGITERQDIERFSKEITTFIHYEMKT